MSVLYNKYKPLFNLLLVLIFVFLINGISSIYFIRLDLSVDKVHSLSNETKRTLKNLDEIITADVYLVGNYPAEIEKLKKSLFEKLDEFKAYGADNFKINYINLDEDPELAKEFKNQVFKDGVDYTDIIISRDSKQEVIRIWSGIILRMGDQFTPVQLLQKGKFPISQLIINQFNDQLEYNIILGLNNLIKPSSEKIKFLRGHGELDNADAWIIRDQLIKYYDVDTIRIKQLKTEYYNNSIDLSNKHYDSLLENKVDSLIISKRSVPLFDEVGNQIKTPRDILRKAFKTRLFLNTCKILIKLVKILMF